MRVALCLSGHIRNLRLNCQSLHTYLLSKFDVDIFAHAWDTYGWRVEGNDITDRAFAFKGFDYYSGDVNREEIVSLLKPKRCVLERYTDYETGFIEKSVRYKTRKRVPHDRPENSVSLCYKIKACNDLKKQYEQENGFIYDVVIRSRFDMLYLGDILTPEILADLNILYTPDVESYGIASDIFAVSSSSNVDVYSNLLDHMDEIFDDGCLMNGHNIFEHYYNKFFPGRWVMWPFPIVLNRCRKDCGKIQCPECDPGLRIFSKQEPIC